MFLENFPSAELIAKEVHSRSDLAKFLDLARKDTAVAAVHIVAHGERTKRGEALVLTRDEEVDLERGENRHLFRDLGVEVIFLSCCTLGHGAPLLERLLVDSGAAAVFSYSDSVDDYQAFLVESLFYHLAFGYFRGRPMHASFEEVYERLRFALDYLGIDDRRDALADPLLAAALRVTTAKSD